MTETWRKAWSGVRAYVSKNSHIYQSIPNDQTDTIDPQVSRNKRTRSKSRRWRNLIILAIAISAALAWAFYVRSWSKHEILSSCDDVFDGYLCQPQISHLWGQYSPFFSVPSEIPTRVPDKCKITFAQMLSRHGARDPTFSKTIKYGVLINQLQSTVTSFRGRYAFLRDYEFTLGADQLTFFGEQQMVNSGAKFYDRYQSLSKSNEPFIRSAGQHRVVASALNWTQGFHASRAADPSSVVDSYPYPILSIPEGAQSNNTLSYGLCPAFMKSTTTCPAQDAFAAVFLPPILSRLNIDLAPADLYFDDAISLMDMCPFDTVASPTGQISPFCALFTIAEWRSYDYFQTLGKFYLFSQGNPLAPTQGIGFTNELIARLTQTPVVDHTSTNSTLDASPDTFPLDRKLYADFSHDNDMMTVWAAMGLYNATRELPWDRIMDARDVGGFAAGWTVPFAARAYFEKMKCEGVDEELVRVVVNDRVLALEMCGGDELGRCKLSAFVDGLSFARSGGEWDKCWV